MKPFNSRNTNKTGVEIIDVFERIRFSELILEHNNLKYSDCINDKEKAREIALQLREMWSKIRSGEIDVIKCQEISIQERKEQLERDYKIVRGENFFEKDVDTEHVDELISTLDDLIKEI